MTFGPVHHKLGKYHMLAIFSEKAGSGLLMTFYKTSGTALFVLLWVEWAQSSHTNAFT